MLKLKKQEQNIINTQPLRRTLEPQSVLQTHLKTPNTLKVNRKSGSLSGFIAQKLLNHMPHSVLHIHAPPG